jgi:hypothetical protein
MDVFQREALSAPTSDSDIRTLNIVILIVSIFSALGAGWIVLSFLVSSPLLSIASRRSNPTRRSDL